MTEADQQLVRMLCDALDNLVDDEECNYDHHGYCQTHDVSKPCNVAVAREALAVGRSRLEADVPEAGSAVDEAAGVISQIRQVKLAAIHVYAIKLLNARPPTSMPEDFAGALDMLRLIERND